MKKRKKRKVIRHRPLYNKCPFCAAGSLPDYKNYESLREFATERARIMSSERTGVCSRHQRRLSLAIKRARYLGLLPLVGEM